MGTGWRGDGQRNESGAVVLGVRKWKLANAFNGAGGQVFLNVVLDEAVEEKAGGEKVRIGMVVSFLPPPLPSPIPSPFPSTPPSSPSPFSHASRFPFSPLLWASNP